MLYDTGPVRLAKRVEGILPEGRVNKNNPHNIFLDFKSNISDWLKTRIKTNPILPVRKMCGICGFVGFEDRDLLKRMCKVIQHRGPDDSGTFTDRDISLGHQRLSIIDLKTGHQPIHNEDESIWIVYNGEVYNFPELKRDLESKGHRFCTETDTEVIVHAYEEYGYDCVKRLNGMFAFALWDSNKKILFLARDRLGIKPLYYTLIDNKILFASEIKSILQYKEIKRKVDLKSLYLLINFMYIPGKTTMFAGIHELLPGHMLVYENRKITVSEYNRIEINPEIKPEGYYVKKLRKVLDRAIERHMISDVPLGSFLSGGLDTSTIVALMTKFSDEPIKTFCMGFGEEVDELPDARLISEYFGTDHYEFVIDPKQGLDILEKTIRYADMPKINLHPYLIYELASKKVKVCMSGTGGDEMFGGYIRRYKAVLLLNKINQITPEIIKKHALTRLDILHQTIDTRTEYNYLWALSHLGKWDDIYLILFCDIIPADEINALTKFNPTDIKPLFTEYFNNKLHPLDKVLLADIKTQLVDNYLNVDDAMSMANSLEIRVPFLDSELVDFTCQLPWNMKVRGGVGKYILRKAMTKELPKRVFEKKKQGFGMSSYYWFKDELKEQGKNLSDSKAINTYFNKPYISRLIKNIPNAKHRNHQLIMTLLAFDIWHKIYIEEER